MLTFTGLRLARALCAASLLLAPVALGQSSEADFYQAHYLHTEGGDLKLALKLFERVADDLAAPLELRQKARVAADEIHEDLATSDFSRLVPASTIFYAELNRPGAQLRELLGQLGLLSGNGANPGLGISPKLLDATLDLRGAAIAITAIDPNGGPPAGVAILHPGNQEALRGLIETALGNGGRLVEPIAGETTWAIEGGAFVTLTQRLVIASQDRAQIQGVLERMRGNEKSSLAKAESLRAAGPMRSDDLLFFHLNAEPVLPLIKAALQEQAKHDPEAALAMAFMDIDSLVSLTGRVGVDKAGVGLDLALELEEGHQNLAFNLLRTPPISEGTLERIPAGVAFFLASSLNEPSAVAPPSGDPERPIVTAMDFGREVFANIVDVVVYGLPPEGGARGDMKVIDVVACIQVNDGRRSRALWNFVLGLASQSSGAKSMEPKFAVIAGHEVEHYTVNGTPIYLFASDKELLISPSIGALSRTFQAREAGHSVLSDPLYKESLAVLTEHSNFALLVSPARCLDLARPFASKQDAREMQQVAAVLQDSVCCVALEQSDTRLALSARVTHLPDVSPLLSQMLESRNSGQEIAYEPKRVPTLAVGEPATAPADPRAHFEQLVNAGEVGQARTAATRLAKSLETNATALNDFAWALLTEDRYQGAFVQVALEISTRSNELTQYGHWALVDTLARANFESGNLPKAIELQKKAIQLAAGTSNAAEAKAPLKTYEAALQEKASPAIGAR